jgi:prepilin-type N-terminal cleavage/methylation domain-containing protein
MSARAFTLVELLIVLAIVLLLVGMLMGGLGVVRASSRKVQARSLVAMVQQALETYRGEDLRRSFPTDPSGDPPPTVIGFAPPELAETRPRVGDLLERVGFSRAQAPRVTTAAGISVLRDPWQQDLNYFLDLGLTGTVAVRPADGSGSEVLMPSDVSDWNPRGLRPFAYCWSWGPTKADNTLKANIGEWIYVRQPQ